VNSAKELQADLIVVGSHGRTGLKRLMLGSVATKVVAESAIPVLVTR
jgi:nucleotide-binding universal stress UspA family protein